MTRSCIKLIVIAPFVAAVLNLVGVQEIFSLIAQEQLSLTSIILAISISIFIANLAWLLNLKNKCFKGCTRNSLSGNIGLLLKGLLDITFIISLLFLVFTVINLFPFLDIFIELKDWFDDTFLIDLLLLDDLYGNSIDVAIAAGYQCSESRLSILFILKDMEYSLKGLVNVVFLVASTILSYSIYPEQLNYSKRFNKIYKIYSTFVNKTKFTGGRGKKSALRLLKLILISLKLPMQLIACSLPVMAVAVLIYSAILGILRVIKYFSDSSCNAGLYKIAASVYDTLKPKNTFLACLIDIFEGVAASLVFLLLLLSGLFFYIIYTIIVFLTWLFNKLFK